MQSGATLGTHIITLDSGLRRNDGTGVANYVKINSPAGLPRPCGPRNDSAYGLFWLKELFVSAHSI